MVVTFVIDVVVVDPVALVVTLAPLQATDNLACVTVVEHASRMVAETNRLAEARLADAGVAWAAPAQSARKAARRGDFTARPDQWLFRCPDRCTLRVAGTEGLHQLPPDRGARIPAEAGPLGCPAYSGACSRMKLSVAK